MELNSSGAGMAVVATGRGGREAASHLGIVLTLEAICGTESSGWHGRRVVVLCIYSICAWN